MGRYSDLALENEIADDEAAGYTEEFQLADEPV